MQLSEKELFVRELEIKLKMQLRKLKICFGGPITSGARGSVEAVPLHSCCPRLWQHSRD